MGQSGRIQRVRIDACGTRVISQGVFLDGYRVLLYCTMIMYREATLVEASYLRHLSRVTRFIHAIRAHCEQRETPTLIVENPWLELHRNFAVGPKKAISK